MPCITRTLQRRNTQGRNRFVATPAELAAFVKAEYDNWGAIIRAQGLKIDN